MYQHITFILCLFICLTQIKSIETQQQQCQAITYYECKNIGYNQTSLPNRFNHQDQKDVALVVSKMSEDICLISNYVRTCFRSINLQL